MFFSNTGFHDAHFNMSYDVFLVHQLTHKNIIPTLRLYGWKPYAISLGYNQSDDFLDKEKCISENVEVVRRPTGGRAVYHSEELTYSIVMFANEKNISTIHNEISQALVRGLKLLGVNATLSQTSPSSEKIYFSEHSSACFSSVSRSEVHVNGKKIIGSAQRRFGDVVLQHGSIMLGGEHRTLPKFYRKQNESHFLHLNETTTEVETELRRKVSYEEISSAIQRGFEMQWEVELKQFPKLLVHSFESESQKNIDVVSELSFV
jgi:lipoate-protein ligase A